MPLAFRVLGPVEVEVDGEPVVLVRQQARHLLALLLLDVGRPVSERRLIALLWPDGPPANARAVLQTTVSRLRSTVPTLSIMRRGDGYALDADPDSVDVHRFRQLVERANRDEDPHARAELARQALALWRGPALADVGTEASRELVCAPIEELRQRALDLRIAADLELGRHAELVGELAELVAADPLNERLVAHLVLALYRSGRRGDALSTCRGARRALAEHLGLDPGPALERLEVAVLRAEPALDLPRPAAAPASEPEAPIPAQLPAPPADLFGRAGERAELDSILAKATKRSSVGVVVITGAPGVGKTALAVRWGQDTVDRFPDGQLYVNLRGYGSDEAMRPIAALAGFLAALGMAPDRIPVDLDQAAAAYRTRLGGRRVLVIVDNAAGVDQVRPLLPGAPGCFAVVTSRDSLSGLVAREDAARVELRPLDELDAVALLARIVGEERAGHEPEAIAGLARTCGRLPLALRIAAAQLVESPHRTIRDHLDRLVAGGPLDALQIAGDAQSAVRMAFDHSYGVLAEATRLVFRSLGAVGLPHYTADSVATLAGIDAAAAAGQLDRLRRSSLVEDGEPHRYLVHDLLHRYAREHAGSELAEAAAHRLYDHFGDRVGAAADLLYPQMLRLPSPTGARGRGVPFESRATALDWLGTELPALVATTLHAADRGHARAASQLADALRGYFWLSSRTVEWFIVAEAGLRAAAAAGDAQGECAARLSLGLACLCTSQYEAAAAHFEAALDLGARSGWPEGEAAAMGSLGTVNLELGRLDTAATHYRDAMELNLRLGRLDGAATNRGNLALVLQLRGRLEEAATEFAAVLAYQRGADLLASQGLNLANLGETQRDLGRHAEAEAALREALRVDRQLGNGQGEASDLARLALLHRDTGELDAAQQEISAALDLLGTVDDPSTECDVQEALGSVLHELGESAGSLAAFTRAAELADRVGYRHQAIGAAIGLAEAYLAVGEPATAVKHARGALDAAVALGYRLYEGSALTTLAAIALSTGAVEDAIAHATAALDLHRATQWRRGEARASRLLDRARRADADGATRTAAGGDPSPTP